MQFRGVFKLSPSCSYFQKLFIEILLRKKLMYFSHTNQFWLLALLTNFFFLRCPVKNLPRLMVNSLDVALACLTST